MKNLLLTLFAFVPYLLAAAPEQGFVSLTNGKDLTGWKTVGGNGQFKFENGEIIGSGENIKANTFLISEKILPGSKAPSLGEKALTLTACFELRYLTSLSSMS